MVCRAASHPRHSTAAACNTAVVSLTVSAACGIAIAADTGVKAIASDATIARPRARRALSDCRG
jgi:hypothetical protein